MWVSIWCIISVMPGDVGASMMHYFSYARWRGCQYDAQYISNVIATSMSIITFCRRYRPMMHVGHCFTFSEWSRQSIIIARRGDQPAARPLPLQDNTTQNRGKRVCLDWHSTHEPKCMSVRTQFMLSSAAIVIGSACIMPTNYKLEPLHYHKGCTG
jgi:hypothetical protein